MTVAAIAMEYSEEMRRIERRAVEPIRVVAQKAGVLVEGVVQALAVRPDVARVEVSIDTRTCTVNITVRATDRDCGILIGRSGIHKRTVQTLLNSLSAKSGIRIYVDIDSRNPIDDPGD